MIAIVDYRAGNLTSVARALHHLNQPYRITADPEVLQQASHVIFPGVGAAGAAMAYLRQTGLDQQIRRLVEMGKPLLGICLGTQVIFEHSEENETSLPGDRSGLCPSVSANAATGRPVPENSSHGLE